MPPLSFRKQTNRTAQPDVTFALQLLNHRTLPVRHFDGFDDVEKVAIKVRARVHKHSAQSNGPDIYVSSSGMIGAVPLAPAVGPAFAKSELRKTSCGKRMLSGDRIGLKMLPVDLSADGSSTRHSGHDWIETDAAAYVRRSRDVGRRPR
jgi:hypothetical protein